MKKRAPTLPPTIIDRPLSMIAMRVTFSRACARARKKKVILYARANARFKCAREKVKRKWKKMRFLETLNSWKRQKRGTNTSPLSHATSSQNIKYNIKMVFATKLQINAVFKKAAPAKKTVTPAKKVRFWMHIVREASVEFEIRAHHHHHLIILGGKRGRKRAKKKDKTQPTFSTRDEREREKTHTQTRAPSFQTL